MPASIASPLVNATKICGCGLEFVGRSAERGNGASSDETADVLAIRIRKKAAANFTLAVQYCGRRSRPEECSLNSMNGGLLSCREMSKMTKQLFLPVAARRHSKDR
jgi:hypothetical protein